MKDDMIELEDKLAMVAAFADTHDDISGVKIVKIIELNKE